MKKKEMEIRYGGPERRRWDRIPIAARAKRLNKSGAEYVFVRDISMCGVGLNSSDRHKMGEMLDLEIAIGEVDGLIKVVGKVVRKIDGDPPGIGVNFVRFTPHSKVRLRAAIRKIARSE